MDSCLTLLTAEVVAPCADSLSCLKPTCLTRLSSSTRARERLAFIYDNETRLVLASQRHENCTFSDAIYTSAPLSFPMVSFAYSQRQPSHSVVHGEPSDKRESPWPHKNQVATISTFGQERLMNIPW